MDYPDTLINPSTGHMLYRITADRFHNEQITGPAPWVDTEVESYIMDIDAYELYVECGFGNPMREIWDVMILRSEGKIGFVVNGPDVWVEPDHPVYVGAR